MIRLSALLCVVVAISSGEASGQLISPGRLSTVHADLEGIRQCTTCHEFRQRGVSGDRCLECHLPLAEQIEAEAGYHGQIETADCAECHKEHFGREFDVRRLDEESFSHDSTGFALLGGHGDEDCRACHSPDLIAEPGVMQFKADHGALSRTFLGLPTMCSTCHVSEDPHDGQFSERGCADCHDEETWEAAPAFDHEETRYPLEGAHRNADCNSCHQEGPSGRYRPTEFASCLSCHEDPHEQSEYEACADCHSVSGWDDLVRWRVERVFDHSTTDFALTGAHAGVECASCHAPRPVRTLALRISPLRGSEARAYPIPASSSCSSCHVDSHDGELSDGPSGGACAACHGDTSWAPSSFGLARHDVDTAFPLTGAHITAPCVSCHKADASDGEPPSLSLEVGCTACHQAEDPHEGRFGDQSCDDCHQTDDFTATAFEDRKSVV